MARVRFPDPASYVGWVCWFSSLHREVSSGYSGFSSPQKTSIWLDLCSFLISLYSIPNQCSSARTIRHLNKAPFLSACPIFRRNFSAKTRWQSSSPKKLHFQATLTIHWATISTQRDHFNIYLIDVTAVDTISNHSQWTFAALKSLKSRGIVEARYAGKTRLEATEIVHF